MCFKTLLIVKDIIMNSTIHYVEDVMILLKGIALTQVLKIGDFIPTVLLVR